MFRIKIFLLTFATKYLVIKETDMQKIIHYLLTAIIIGGLLQTSAVSAQDQIIIRKKKDTKEKVTIVVEGDKITVNGKPVDEFKSEDLEISHFDMPDVQAFNYSFESPALERLHGLRDLQHSYGSGWAEGGRKRNEAFLGVQTEETDKGARITEITKESPADKAGLKEDDYITKVNDKEVNGPDDLYEAIGEYKPEEKVSVTFTRNGKTEKKEIALAKNKDIRVYGWQNNDGNNYNFSIAPPEFPGGGFMSFGRPRMGAMVQDTEDNSGVKVLELEDDCPASKAGLKEGDIITSVDGKNITATDDIRKILKDVKDGDTFTIKYKRDNQEQTTTLRFPKELKTIGL